MKLRPRSSTDSIRRSAVTLRNVVLSTSKKQTNKQTSILLISIPSIKCKCANPNLYHQVSRSASLRLSSDSLSNVSNDIRFWPNRTLSPSIAFRDFFDSEFSSRLGILRSFQTSGRKSCRGRVRPQERQRKWSLRSRWDLFFWPKFLWSLKMPKKMCAFCCLVKCSVRWSIYHICRQLLMSFWSFDSVGRVTSKRLCNW